MTSESRPEMREAIIPTEGASQAGGGGRAGPWPGGPWSGSESILGCVRTPGRAESGAGGWLLLLQPRVGQHSAQPASCLSLQGWFAKWGGGPQGPAQLRLPPRGVHHPSPLCSGHCPLPALGGPATQYPCLDPRISPLSASPFPETKQKPQRARGHAHPTRSTTLPPCPYGGDVASLLQDLSRPQQRSPAAKQAL